MTRFLARHPQLSVRKANPIKRSRAAVSHDKVNAFFEQFTKCRRGAACRHVQL
jgi:hypothetical protein